MASITQQKHDLKAALLEHFFESYDNASDDLRRSKYHGMLIMAMRHLTLPELREWCEHQGVEWEAMKGGDNGTK